MPNGPQGIASGGAGALPVIPDFSPDGWPGGWTLIALGDVGSTNDEAQRRAAEGVAHGTVITARSQDRGRGRYRRHWVSPVGNLYTSIILRPPVEVAAAGQLGFVTALAIADLVAALLPAAEIGLKWPNDVLLAGAKVSGVLLESTLTADGRIDAVIVGAGVNLISHPRDTLFPAGDLRAAGAGTVAPTAALSLYVTAFARWYHVWLTDGFAAVRRCWLDRAAGLNAPLAVRLDDETVSGVFEDVDTAGALVLRLPGGQRRTITTGDVFWPSGVPGRVPGAGAQPTPGIRRPALQGAG